MDDWRSKFGDGNDAASDTTSALRQKAETREGTLGGRKREPTLATVRQRATATVLGTAGTQSTVLRAVPAVQRGRSQVLSGGVGGSDEDTSAFGAKEVSLEEMTLRGVASVGVADFRILLKTHHRWRYHRSGCKQQLVPTRSRRGVDRSRVVSIHRSHSCRGRSPVRRRI